MVGLRGSSGKKEKRYLSIQSMSFSAALVATGLLLPLLFPSVKSHGDKDYTVSLFYIYLRNSNSFFLIIGGLIPRTSSHTNSLDLHPPSRNPTSNRHLTHDPHPFYPRSWGAKSSVRTLLTHPDPLPSLPPPTSCRTGFRGRSRSSCPPLQLHPPSILAHYRT